MKLITGKIHKHSPWLIPLIGLLLITPWISVWDLQIEKHFYVPGVGFDQTPWLQWIFSYGPLPGLVLSIGSFLFFLFTFPFSAIRQWRAEALLLCLTMAIGSGLIVHALLKDHWGRPRPRQIEQFGGTQEFRPYYRPDFFGQTEHAKSFPCGHCSTGFYFFSLALIAKRKRRPKLYYAALIFSFVLGGLLSYARMAQGGHFFSDVIVSALIIWLTAYALCECLLPKEKTS